MNYSQSHVTIFTDGACKGNPGPGGWGAYIIGRKGDIGELFGGASDTTNNQMELLAAINALEWLKKPRPILLYTDSKYLKDGITKWITNWKQNGWKTSSKKPVKNQDLWQRLDTLINHHSVEWIWVQGHSGNEGNEKADSLANKGMEPFKG